MNRTLALVFITAAIALADEPARRQVNQQQRINQGVRSGELTRAEAARLQRQKADLHRQIARDRADGRGLAPAERARIDAQQDALNRRIARQKHDKQSR